MIIIDSQLGFSDGIVDAVVNVELGRILGTDPGTPDIRFVSQNQGCRQGVDGDSGTFVVVANGGDHEGDLIGREAHVIQDPERHNSTALAVFHSVYKIADVVKISRNFGEFHHPVRISQSFQNVAGEGCHTAYVCKTVLGVAKGDERCVRL